MPENEIILTRFLCSALLCSTLLSFPVCIFSFLYISISCHVFITHVLYSTVRESLGSVSMETTHPFLCMENRTLERHEEEKEKDEV